MRNINKYGFPDEIVVKISTLEKSIENLTKTLHVHIEAQRVFMAKISEGQVKHVNNQVDVCSANEIQNLQQHLAAIRDIKMEFDLTFGGISSSTAVKLRKAIRELGAGRSTSLSISMQTVYKVYDDWINIACVRRSISRRVSPYCFSGHPVMPQSRVQRSQAFLDLANWISGNKK